MSGPSSSLSNDLIMFVLLFVMVCAIGGAVHEAYELMEDTPAPPTMSEYKYQIIEN